MPRVVEARNIGEYYVEKPFRLIIAGGSGSGKTRFVQQFVNNQHYTSPFNKITYYFPQYMDDDCPEFSRHVEYRSGLPEIEELAQLPPNTLIILDDLMHECAKSVKLEQLFSVVARKRNISIILVVQNIYHPGLRNIRLNSSGMVLFKFHAAVDVNHRVLRDLGLRELITKDQMAAAYDERYSYIYINIHPNRQFDFGTLRANIFDKYINIYCRMEYIAIPKSDFVKYFKIIESKNGRIKAVKNAVKIKPNRKRQRTERADTSNESSNTNDQSGTTSTDESE